MKKLHQTIPKLFIIVLSVALITACGIRTQNENQDHDEMMDENQTEMMEGDNDQMHDEQSDEHMMNDTTSMDMNEEMER
ncbi:MAG: hypothetical protein CMO01_00710 [Thalassobius sp.]|nr:hypothetical protein [Thalassovita sp.]|tara:strand:+ start:209 stop:445 length:237 start_codon:yes stop_codon:yes gene_type:complete